MFGTACRLLALFALLFVASSFSSGLVAANETDATKPPVIRYVATLPRPDVTVIDVRPESACAQKTLRGARCLPATAFYGQHQRLANWSGILWTLGTAGLTGSEAVAIIGPDHDARDFVAGLLFVAGQNKITVVTTAAAQLIAQAGSAVPGQMRATTRQSVWQNTMRSDSIILRNELVQAIHSNRTPDLLDGRTDNEYWGRIKGTQRGGHLPGAVHSPLRQWQANDATAASTAPSGNDNQAILYAHHATDGLAFLARTRATGLNTRLYLAGWAQWSSHGELPIDAASYPRPVVQQAALTKPTHDNRNDTSDLPGLSIRIVAGAALTAVSLIGIGYLLGTRLSRAKQAAAGV